MLPDYLLNVEHVTFVKHLTERDGYVPCKLQSRIVFPRHTHFAPLAVLVEVAALGDGVVGQAVRGLLGTGDRVLTVLDEALLTDALPEQALLDVGALPVDPQTVLVVHAAGQTCRQITNKDREEASCKQL